MTNSGANIDGNIDTGGGSFIGRDNIQNIIVVGQLLELAEIQKLFPQPSPETSQLTNVAEALEKVFSQRQSAELSKSIAFAGYVLKDFLASRAPKNEFETVNFQDLLKGIDEHIGRKLVALKYWEKYCQPYNKWAFEPLLHDSRRAEDRVIEFTATMDLFMKYGVIDDDTSIALVNSPGNRALTFTSLQMVGKFVFFMKQPKMIGSTVLSYKEVNELQAANLTPDQSRLFLIGIVVDLVRLYALSLPDTRFFQNLVDSLGLKQKGA